MSENWGRRECEVAERARRARRRGVEGSVVDGPKASVVEGGGVMRGEVRERCGPTE